MARRSETLIRGSARALTAVVLAVGVSACAVPLASTSGSPAPHGTSTSTGLAAGEVILVCSSGQVSNGGVDTSSSVAVRVPAGTPVPPGCRES